VVTVPFYGQNHARQHKTDKVLLDTSKSGWYHDLNRDPRTRVPAGFGTRVIQKDQEKFMQRAWQQVQKVYEGNRMIRNYQFTIQVSSRYTAQFFAELSPARLLAVTMPVHAKVLGSPTTIRQQLIESRLLTPVFSAPFRRLVRPAGKLTQRLNMGGQPFDYSELVTAINEGRVTPAPPRAVPAGIPSVDDLAKRIQPRSFPAWLLWLMRHRLAVLLAALVLLLFAGIFSGVWVVCGVLAMACLGSFQWLREQNNRTDAAEVVTDPAKAKAAIEAVPPRPDFNVFLDDEPAALPPTPGAAPAGDSLEAHNFRSAAG
jgi:hypothetical protein